jgi:hypothetical protein
LEFCAGAGVCLSEHSAIKPQEIARIAKIAKKSKLAIFVTAVCFNLGDLWQFWQSWQFPECECLTASFKQSV